MEKDSKEEMRKGPWTEQEDMQLVLYVNMFGDRRWDFIAKVSGLKRSGKSCRLRWVNYLHPGLKRGKITPHEERLVLELHRRWGNRWSKIAQKLPGRTDNEIKNYWRTLMRKKAQERKKGVSLSSSSSSLSSNSPVDEFNPSGSTEIKEQGNSFYDTGGVGEKKNGSPDEEEERSKTSSMEELWKEFEFSEDICSSHMISPNTVESPVWDYSPISDTLWSVDEEESKLLMKAMAMGTDDHFYPFPFSNYFM